MHASAMEATREFVKQYLSGRMRVADIGALDVDGSTKPLFEGHEYVGFDIQAGKSVDVVMTETEIPVPDASFDVAVSTNTLEHARQPWTLVKEMARILKPGGVVFLLAPMPNAHRYHAHPIDCWRAYTEGFRGLFDYAGLQTVKLYEAADHDTVGIARKN